MLYVALGGADERAMIERLAAVGEAADRFGVPFIAEAEWPSAYSSLDDVSELGTDYLLRSVRLCAELGADVIKTNWPGSEEEFAQLVDAATGFPVVLAGGSRISDEELLSRQETAMRAGAVGCSVGRNIFMHERPEAITRALRRVIVDRWPRTGARGALAARSCMTGGDLVVGVDVGSQGACLSAFTADGERAATTYQPYTVSYPRPGWAEQDPNAWIAAMRAGFRGLSVEPDRVAAISFASQLDGLVAVDEDGGPLGPAIIWMDRRADALCDDVEITKEEWYRRSGCNLDGSHVAAKIAWQMRNGAEAARYLLPGAFLLRAATGADVVDAANASSTMALDPRTLEWDDGLLSAFGIDPARLPRVVACDAVVGEVTQSFAA